MVPRSLRRAYFSAKAGAAARGIPEMTARPPAPARRPGCDGRNGSPKATEGISAEGRHGSKRRRTKDLGSQRRRDRQQGSKSGSVQESGRVVWPTLGRSGGTRVLAADQIAFDRCL